MEASSERKLKIIIGGDLFPSKRNLELFERGKVDDLYDEKIRKMFASSDFCICNLEGVFTDHGKPIKKVDPIIFAPTASVAGIKGLGVHCVSLANNHIYDCGNIGIAETQKTLNENGISFFGAGLNIEGITSEFRINIQGFRVGFYAVSETMFNIPDENSGGANLYDEYRVCREIQNLKEKCDRVIVLYHGGTEFFWYKTDYLKKRFYRMADNGADLIIAQHTHCIGAFEQYGESTLIYGQGDFLFARSVNEYKETGILLEVTITPDSMETTRHLIRHVDNHVVYDPHQDLSAYDARSAEKDVKERYKEYCEKKVALYLEAFRGKNIQDRVLKKILPREKYIEHLVKAYNEKQILRIISGLQFEEFNDAIVHGLWDLIHKESN